MKKIVLTGFIIGMIHCCAQESIHLKSIEFSSQTRGDRLHLIVNEKNVVLHHNGDTKECELKKEDWSSLKKTISNQKIKHASEFVSESDDRFVDRAKISSIKFITNQTHYETNSFDNFNAPKEFKALMVEIQKIMNLKCLKNE